MISSIENLRIIFYLLKNDLMMIKRGKDMD
jgi:hypothetical protein